MLKLIALTTMIIDHIGFFWDIELCRVVGRLSFPIYCFLIARGIEKSKNLKQYSIRILVLAIASQCVWNYIGVEILNILFTYFLFIQFMYFIKSKNNIMSAVIFVLSVVISPKLDYGLYGFLLLIMFYYIKDIKVQIIVMLGLNIYFVYNGLVAPIQFISMISLILVRRYDKQKYYKKFKKYNKIFYISYPLHILILFEIYKLLIN